MINAKYNACVGEESVARVSSLIATAFGGPVKDCEEWVRNQGLTDLRSVDRSSDGRADACLRRIEMGQFFGGRSVPMIGIAGVAVAPEARGQGLARWMMRRATEEMHDRGEPLSALYASTQPLYRQVGYEQAGHRVAFTLPVNEIDCRERCGNGGRWESITFEQVERLMPVYKQFASRFSGPLDRGPYVWKRVFDWRSRKAIGYASVGSDGRVEGYAVVAQKQKDTGRITIEVTDMAFVDADAGRRVLGMLHDYASMADEVTFYGGAHHPLLSLLAQQRSVGTFKEYWMLRVVRPADALRLRGYNPAVDTELHLHITDDTLPGNTGPLVVRVKAGRAEVSTGGRGEIRLTERSLASLYSGFSSPATLRLAGMIEGPESAVAAAGMVFGGDGSPWMPDFF
ncbi:MAG TPA: GNAT family N-acetyltransferase [Phycisphaerales bacterium]|nr:GNAT family N-acetyltransferase [Phycisphaerales bacterium]